MTKNYYSTTAYDSSNKRKQAPFDKTEMSLAEKSIRKHPVSIIANQCNEYLSYSNAVGTVLEIQNFNQSKYQQAFDLKLHETFRWTTGKNKKAQVESMVFGAWWFWFFGGIFGSIISLIVRNFELSLGLFYAFLIMFVLPFTLWSLGKYALKNNWFKDENNIVFNRRTGMITIPCQDGEVSLPFDEFDPFMTTSMTVAASTNMILRLMHRYSDKNIVNPSPYSRSWEFFADWEQIQRFMDISKPLPDIPTYDFAREHDPVSAAYDKKYNRPKDYWKNCDLDKIDKLETASINAAEKFPWGETREQAIQSSWKPSGVGEGDWRESQKDNAA